MTGLVRSARNIFFIRYVGLSVRFYQRWFAHGVPKYCYAAVILDLTTEGTVDIRYLLYLYMNLLAKTLAALLVRRSTKSISIRASIALE